MEPRLLVEELLSTRVGALFVDGIFADYLASQQIRSTTPTEYVAAITVRNLYGLSSIAASASAHSSRPTPVPADDPRFDRFCDELAETVTTRTPHRPESPQIHHGFLDRWHQPAIANRNYEGASLPEGAFWTSDAVDDTDSWSLGPDGDLSQGSREYLVSFDAASLRSLTIDSAATWQSLVEQCPRSSDRTNVTVDWSAAASVYDAIYLSVTGLLTAHAPLIPASSPGVVDWGAASTAWLNLPGSISHAAR